VNSTADLHVATLPTSLQELLGLSALADANWPVPQVLSVFDAKTDTYGTLVNAFLADARSANAQTQEQVGQGWSGALHVMTTTRRSCTCTPLQHHAHALWSHLRSQYSSTCCRQSLAMVVERCSSCSPPSPLTHRRTR
jgi:hypothetical protein